MNATVLDLRKNMRSVLAALDRNESVMLTCRGKKKAVIVPCGKSNSRKEVSEYAAFGIWADRKDMEDVSSYVRTLRKGRF
jgi:antitoxin (DNA-binding transcriptional repressor) of toxin-antitoxin stability system